MHHFAKVFALPIRGHDGRDGLFARVRKIDWSGQLAQQLGTGGERDLRFRKAQDARRAGSGKDGGDGIAKSKGADDAGGAIAQRRCGPDALDAAFLVDALAGIFDAGDADLYGDRSVIGKDKMIEAQLDLRGFVSHSKPYFADLHYRALDRSAEWNENIAPFFVDRGDQDAGDLCACASGVGADGLLDANFQRSSCRNCLRRKRGRAGQNREAAGSNRTAEPVRQLRPPIGKPDVVSIAGDGI